MYIECIWRSTNDFEEKENKQKKKNHVKFYSEREILVPVSEKI